MPTIAKPTPLEPISFVDQKDRTHTLNALDLQHMFGNAQKKAEAVGQGDNTQAVYGFFRDEIATRLGDDVQASDIAHETVLLVAGVMQDQVNELKKKCVTLASSPS